MRRHLTGGLAALAAGSIAAVAVAAGAPRASLRDFKCHTARNPAKRKISVVAVMRPVAGTEHMAVRFELLSQSMPGGAFGEVHGGDLEKFVSPKDPTLGQQPGDVWVLSHPVHPLPAPATYRFRVTFRWTGTEHHVLATTVLPSPTCFQPELRPDLLVQAIYVQPVFGKPRENRYVAVIRNAGLSAAGRFEVEFVDQGSTQTATIHRLGPHASKAETFIGPQCSSASPPTVTVDPRHAIDDVNPRNNTLRATCPGA